MERGGRAGTNFVNGYTGPTDVDRAQTGTSVSDGKRATPPAPGSRPALSILYPEYSTQRLRLTDETTPTRNGRPRGTRGAEGWLKRGALGEPVPTNPLALSYLALATNPTYRATSTPGDGNKTTVAMHRWVNTQGEMGLRSENWTATMEPCNTAAPKRPIAVHH